MRMWQCGLRLLIDDEDRLVVEPSAQTIRRNLSSVCWHLPGIDAQLKLVAPFFQGCRQDLEHPLIAGKQWEWPHRWEAPLAISKAMGTASCDGVRSATRQPKAVRVGAGETARSLGFETLYAARHTTAWLSDRCNGSSIRTRATGRPQRACTGNGCIRKSARCNSARCARHGPGISAWLCSGPATIRKCSMPWRLSSPRRTC